jgi:hypothetical protein
VDTLPTTGGHLADSLPTTGGLLTNHWPTPYQPLADSLPTTGRLLIDTLTITWLLFLYKHSFIFVIVSRWYYTYLTNPSIDHNSLCPPAGTGGLPKRQRASPRNISKGTPAGQLRSNSTEAQPSSAKARLVGLILPLLLINILHETWKYVYYKYTMYSSVIAQTVTYHGIPVL